MMVRRFYASAAVALVGLAFGSVQALAGNAVFGPAQKASVQTQPASAGWNEPAGITASDGYEFTSFQNGITTLPTTGVSTRAPGGGWQASTAYASYDASRTDGDFGDVTMAADNAKDVFFGHLNNLLQANIDYTWDGGASWHTASDVAQLPTSASSSPFLVDRPWIAAYSPDTNFLHTKVYLTYHDFAASAVYVVTCGMSGTAASRTLSCGMPIVASNGQSACNTIPGGIAVAPSGSPHAGRVYTVWQTADPPTNVLSGCNYTQLAPFYRIYVAYSDTPATGPWTVSQVYSGPTGDPACPDTGAVAGTTTATCADASEIFTPVAVDRAGNVYVAFVDYIDTLDKNYDVYLSASTSAGASFSAPVRVDHSPGTHFFPAVVAGDAGRVSVGYIGTPTSDRPFEAGDTCPSTFPPLTSCQGKAMPEPANAQWYAYVSVSYNASSSTPTFSENQVSGTVIHYGDVCNLGIYCDGSSTGNRSLWDATGIFTDLAGYVTFTWTDQRADTSGQYDAAQGDAQRRQAQWDEVYTACQTGGTPLLKSATGPAACASTH